MTSSVGFPKLAIFNKKSGSKKRLSVAARILSHLTSRGATQKKKAGSINQLFDIEKIKNRLRVLQRPTKIGAG
jgi:hypothetical protein